VLLEQLFEADSRADNDMDYTFSTLGSTGAQSLNNGRQCLFFLVVIQLIDLMPT
jgi:hypothetical protein